ncbi:MAG: hypothetical protein CMJ95_02365, partial [Planctomycetes bacterium]|nr:hypothetical protein [Planctomycetota bacterium]
MSRLHLIFLLILFTPVLMEAQESPERWSYPYGEGRVSLIEDNSLLAVKLIAGLEDELGSLQAELRSIRGVMKIDDRNRQEYPRLWYVPLVKGIRPEVRQQALERIAAATVVEFAGPILG